jgi:hypothetical protein
MCSKDSGRREALITFFSLEKVSISDYIPAFEQALQRKLDYFEKDF